MSRPNDILSKKGCPKCAGNTKKTHKEYVAELSIIDSNIEVVEEYVNAKTKILHRCKIDGYEWYALPTNVLRGTGCSMCNGGVKITHEQYVEKVALINRNIQVVDIYTNNLTPIMHMCKICGHKWIARPYNILIGCGCPKCNMSHGERNVESYLIRHNVNYIWQHRFDDCRNKSQLPFDFYLPDYNMCIEYDGIQHFEPTYFAGKGEEWALEQFKEMQQRDVIKDKYCEENNIILLRIKYNEDVEEILDLFFDRMVSNDCR